MTNDSMFKELQIFISSESSNMLTWGMFHMEFEWLFLKQELMQRASCKNS